MIDLARAMRDRTGNLGPMPGIFPDYPAPIVRTADDGVRELAMARWGMPSPRRASSMRRPSERTSFAPRAATWTSPSCCDWSRTYRARPCRGPRPRRRARTLGAGTTNVRNTASAHWRPWLGPEYRCLDPFTSFSEPDQASGSLQPVWFALAEDRPLAVFAGVHKLNHTCVRKAKDGEVTCDLFAFLTTEPNAEVAAVHPKAIPVILTTEEEREVWMTAPWEKARALQCPLESGSLRVVAQGSRTDGETTEGGYAG